MTRRMRAEYLLFAAAVLIFAGLITTFQISHAKNERPYGMLSFAAGTKDAYITGTQAAQIKQSETGQENPVIFTAWHETPMQQVTAQEGTRSAAVSLIAIRGSSECLIPYGKILHEEDKDGCLLSADVAERLFGDRNAENLTVCIGTKELTVRGMLEAYEGILVCQQTDEEAGFSRINLLCKGGDQTPEAAAERFMGRYGIDMIKVDGRGPLLEELLELVPGKWSDFAGWRANIESRMRERREQSRIPASSLEK